MYTYEERIKAVKLYLKFDLSAADTIRELGYPNRKMLVRWYREYLEAGDLHKKFIKHPNYSPEQIRVAVDYYLEHGRNVCRTIRAVGYPTRETLRQWIDELAPGERKVRIKRSSMLQFSQEQKKDAVIDLCVREGSAEAVAKDIGVSRYSLYKWKREMLDEECGEKMQNKNDLPDDIAALRKESEFLKKEIYRQQLELDILKKAAEIIKKGQGIDPRKLANREKASLIDALRTEYPLNDLLQILEMAKSSYFYQVHAQSKLDKYADLKKEVKRIFHENKQRYGYRRVHAEVRRNRGAVSEKVILNIMKEEALVVVGKKGGKYNSYKGEISPSVENVLNRNFHADEPNKKWVTDLTEFHIPAGKVYLSPMIDCFDGMAVSWAIGTSPDAELVNTMLDDAVNTLCPSERPAVHSDRGCHYRWPGWISRIEEAGLIRSMSKKGCSPDNAACEGFFGILKNEMFYGRSWKNVSLDQFMNELDSYLRWYNDKRIKISLGALSPVEYRKKIGLAA